MSKRVTKCYGSTRAELEAECIAFGASRGGTHEESIAAMERLIASGAFWKCSNHPDHYIAWRPGMPIPDAD